MINSMITRLFIAVTLGVVVLSSSTTYANELDDLKAKFKARYAKLAVAVNKGMVGETWQGKVDAVKGRSLDAATAGLVKEENADRDSLYAIIAKSQKTTPQLVAARNAQRNFSRAKSGVWLKFKDGWKQKK